MTSWFKARLGQFRVSTVVLIVAFIALFWVQQTFTPEPAPETTAPAVVPPGFVPDPNYTWVPRTNVRRPYESETTTTSPTETTPAPDDATTSPTSPEPSPTTTVIDPDGPGGPLGQQTLTQTPAQMTPTTTPTDPDAPETVPATPGAPR